MARPKKPFDWSKLDAILQYGACLADCADIMDVSEDTVERQIKKEHNLRFAEYRLKKMSKMRVGILKKQVEVAMSGNVTMLIWVGKQYLGQVDKIEQETNATINLDYKVIDATDTP
jgi:Asp-tRNA(Asn)/Glu-tRNA(Gln) amidotransferase A subunit family amidase